MCGYFKVWTLIFVQLVINFLQLAKEKQNEHSRFIRIYLSNVTQSINVCMNCLQVVTEKQVMAVQD